MITSREQAKAVQERRYKAGKRGYSKAVRNYFLKTNPENYHEEFKGLKVRWNLTKEQQKARNRAEAREKRWRKKLARMVKQYRGEVI